MSETRTVRIVNRWWAEPDPGYHGVRVDEVTRRWVCPTCGGPRGEPYLTSQCEDGDWLWVHRWSNDCGHVDYYRDVARESERPPQGEIPERPPNDNYLLLISEADGIW